MWTSALALALCVTSVKWKLWIGKKTVYEQPSKRNAHVYFFKKYKWNDFFLCCCYCCYVSVVLLLLLHVPSFRSVWCSLWLWNMKLFYWIVFLVRACACISYCCHFQTFRFRHPKHKATNVRENGYKTFASVKWTLMPIAYPLTFRPPHCRLAIHSQIPYN